MSERTVMRWNVYLILLVVWSFGAPAQALEIYPQSSREISHGIMSIWGAKGMIDEVAANCHRSVPAVSEKFRVASDAGAMRNRDALETAAFVHERFMAVFGRYVQIRAYARGLGRG